MIILTIATLREYDACELDDRIQAYRDHHGHDPGDAPTLRSWLACTLDVRDWIWATRCLGRAGRILALEVATRAARRALVTIGREHTADPRPLRAIEAAEVILMEWWAGREPTEEMLFAANAARRAAADAADAAYATYTAAAYATYTAANAAAYATYTAANAAVAAAANAANSANSANAAAAAERAQQRADYLAALDRLESPDAR